MGKPGLFIEGWFDVELTSKFMLWIVNSNETVLRLGRLRILLIDELGL